MENLPWRRAAMILAVLFVSIMIFESFKAGNESVQRTSTVPYSVFKAQVKAGNVTKVVLTPVSVTAELANPLPAAGSSTPVKVIKSEMPTIQDPELMPLLEAKGVEVTADREEGTNTFWIFIANALPFLLLIGFWVWTSRRAQARQMGPFGNFGQVKAKMFDETMPKTTFNDVAGMKAQKYELEEVVDFLKRPEKYEKIGGKIPTGILLMGPPGTGKTLLAKAVAGEAGVPFFSTSASEFIEMFVGVGASRVRDLFKRAREAAPSIIFIDEIDAVGRSRGTGLGGGHDEREQTLNQLLGEMDGFEGHERVIVVAATNRPDVLDSALLRPGRFDRQVMVDLPTQDDRTEILKVHTRKLPLAPDVDLALISRGCPGMSGADLENLCNEAALFAARYNHSTVNAHHFELAKDKLLMGLERPGLTSDAEKRITAYHEAGHTLVARLIPGMDPVHKVTVLPRGPALGVTQLIPEEDRHYYPKSFLMGKLSVSLGGRAAEQMIFGDTSTGAQSDLKYTTNLAEKMVCQWGMSERVGPVTFSRGEEHVFLGKKIAQDKLYSEQMGWIIDQEIESIVRGAERHALELLEKNGDKLELLANALLEREELLGEEVDKVLAGEALGPRREKDTRLPDAEPPAPENAEGDKTLIAEA